MAPDLKRGLPASRSSPLAPRHAQTPALSRDLPRPPPAQPVLLLSLAPSLAGPFPRPGGPSLPQGQFHLVLHLHLCVGRFLNFFFKKIPFFLASL